MDDHLFTLVPFELSKPLGDLLQRDQLRTIYLGNCELVGKPAKIVYTTEGTYTSLIPETTYMHEILGECEVGWKEACRELVEARVWEKGYVRAY